VGQERQRCPSTAGQALARESDPDKRRVAEDLILISEEGPILISEERTKMVFGHSSLIRIRLARESQTLSRTAGKVRVLPYFPQRPTG